MSNRNIDDAISSLQAAFSEGASLEEMKKGEKTLDAMLAALRGAMSATKEPAAVGTPEYAAPKAASTPGEKRAAKAPDMLDFVVGFLKSKLDKDDLAAIEAQAPPFSVPFINM